MNYQEYINQPPDFLIHALGERRAVDYCKIYKHYMVDFDANMSSKMYDWCYENFQGEWHFMLGKCWAFENQSDFVLFKLKYYT